MEMLKKLIKIARIDHWIKQLFILPGILLAMVFVKDSEFNVLNVILTILATCFIASANYIINEYLDREFDKYHPTKKNRTLVTDSIDFKFILLDYLVFAIIGLALSFAVGKMVFFTEIWLLVMGILYNVKPMRTKDVPILDVLSESINNVIRLLIGWFCITSTYLPPVSIVFGYWMIGAFLMNVKRYSEYMSIPDKKDAGLYRKSFKFYDEKKLLLLSIFYAILAIFFCGVFAIKYRIEFIIMIPFVAFFFCYYISLSYKKDSAVMKPEKLYREKGLIVFIVALIALGIVLGIVNLPMLNVFLTNELVLISM